MQIVVYKKTLFKNDKKKKMIIKSHFKYSSIFIRKSSEFLVKWPMSRTMKNINSKQYGIFKI